MEDVIGLDEKLEHWVVGISNQPKCISLITVLQLHNGLFHPFEICTQVQEKKPRGRTYLFKESRSCVETSREEEKR